MGYGEPPGAIWKCPYCKKPFTERKDAELHIRQAHARQVGRITPVRRARAGGDSKQPDTLFDEPPTDDSDS